MNKTDDNLIYCLKYEDGAKYWYRNGDLYLIEYASGNKEWFQNGKLHRLDGPAIERADGSQEWWQNNKCHRTNGPAIEREDGTKVWYRNGKYIKSCFPKTITIQEDGIEKQTSICCIECVRCYKHISEEKFYKLSLLL